MTIRVRFAPSPTGYLHIGGLRTMLYNYFFARRGGGSLVLRIEDTDQTRSIPGGIKALLQVMQTLGIDYDEGPEERDGKIAEKGQYGPYIQSHRLDLYKKYANELVAKGGAFHDPEAPQVIRLKVPETGETTFQDLIRGEITFKNEAIDPTVLLKSDGYPTYHLANVVDDHLMQITHVIRGDEWISSAPKHVLLYQAFDWQPPKFAHLPLLLNQDKSKLSKRQMDVSVEDYLAKGYLPNALINFIALLGWNPRGDQEIYTREELVKQFDLESVNKSGAVVNLEKLDWLNNHYLRQLTALQLINLVRPYVERAGYRNVEQGTLQKIVMLEQERLRKLGDFPEETSYCYVRPHYEPELLRWKKIEPAAIRERLGALLEHLKALPDAEFEAGKLEGDLKAWIASSGLENGEVLSPLRVALTGRKSSPPPFAIAEILGKDEVLARIDKAIKML